MGCDPPLLFEKGGHNPKWNYNMKKDYFDQMSESSIMISEWGVIPLHPLLLMESMTLLRKVISPPYNNNTNNNNRGH